MLQEDESLARSAGKLTYGRGTQFSRSEPEHASSAAGQFIDLFSGCGGLSLGLCWAGWKGRFAVEKDDMAFSTFAANFLDHKSGQQFDWPDWLPKSSSNIVELLSANKRKLQTLKGTIDLIAGGPPCQGFSFTGKRNKSDPRNQLFKKYVEFVRLVKPKALLIENVPGMSVPHGKKSRSGKKTRGRPPTSHLQKLTAALEKAGYVSHAKTLDPVEFGVPQKRLRLIVVGLRADIASALKVTAEGAYDLVLQEALHQSEKLGLPKVVTAAEAISDLEVSALGTASCIDPQSPKGFSVPAYKGPATHYQLLLNDGVPPNDMDSTRLARHSVTVSERFTLILSECRRGVRMDNESRQRYGLEKYRIYPMAANMPAPTLTTLPDDVLHYSEPRILSVRETARLQSFPDWFVFRGKYTTGGDRRTKECPRYTQVGNAVPPLLARAIGVGLAKLLATIPATQQETPPSRRKSQKAGDF